MTTGVLSLAVGVVQPAFAIIDPPVLRKAAAVWEGPDTDPVLLGTGATAAQLTAAGYTQPTDVDPAVPTDDQQITLQAATTDLYGTDLNNVPDDPEVEPDALDPDESGVTTASTGGVSVTADDDVPAGADTFTSGDATDFPSTAISSWDQSTGGISTASITQADCNSKAAKRKGGRVINHFEYCATRHAVYLATVNNREVGGADVTWRNRGWADKGSRRVEFVLDVMSVTTWGELTKTNTYLTMGEGCVGSSDACTAGSTNSSRRLSLSGWTNQGVSFAFTNTKAKASSPHYFRFGDFFPKFTWDSPYPTKSANGSGNSFRCDSDVAFAKLRARQNGCIFNKVTPFITFSTSNTSYGDESKHIYTALTHPASTYPSVANKKIPDVINRLYSASGRAANHAASVKVCKAVWGTGYSQGGTKHCDEYPFQSAKQGGAAGSSFSVRPILAGQNTKGGSHLGAWYNSDRIADSDKFRVRVIK